MRKEKIPFNRLEVGKKYFIMHTNVDFAVLILTNKRDNAATFDRLNVYKTPRDIGIERWKHYVRSRSEWEGNISTSAWVFRRKHYAKIFDLLFN